MLEVDLAAMRRLVESLCYRPLFVTVSGENISVGNLDWPFHEARLAELETLLDRAFDESKLPEDRDRSPVNELPVRVRLANRA